VRDKSFSHYSLSDYSSLAARGKHLPNYVGWYSLLGCGVQRDWAYEQLEVTGSQNVAPVYGAQL
jgi:hypothetical protein